MRKFTHPIFVLFFFLWIIKFASGQSVFVSNPSSCGLNIPLTDNTCPENNPNIFLPDRIGISVSGQPGTALGVDVYLKEVRLILSHTWMSDVGITLTSPGGRTVLLTANNGGSGDHLGDPIDASCTQYAVFSTSACISIAQGAPPYTDRAYLPMESLLHFNDSITNPNGLWILNICDDVPNDVGILQYVQLVFEPIFCLPIQQKQIVNVDSTTVTLLWSPAGDCSGFIIEYGAPGFVPGTGFEPGGGNVELVTQCPPYALADLAPDTDYDIYVRRFCPAGGGFSGNGCALTVRTGCQPPPTTMVETFDAATPCFPNCAAVCNINGFWRNVGGDDFDWLVYQGASPTLNTGPGAGFNGAGRYAYIETSGSLCNNGRLAFLESNCVRLRKFGTDTCHLSFFYHMFGANVNTLQLQVSNDGGFSWSTLWQRSGNQGNAWRKAYIGLGAYPEGAVLKFRFAGSGGNGSLGDIALDQIVFHGSEDLGSGTYIYYVDADGDGYGRSDAPIQSCNPNPPSGYATQGGDCNDNNPNIHPGRPEIPCNGVDENCNGMADDEVLPSPQASGAMICSGQPVQLCAQAAFGGFLLWYSTPAGDDSFVDFGACISPLIPPNNSPVPVTHYFYVEEFAPPCKSPVRTQVAVVVNPVPDAAPVAPVSVCPGQPLNLAEISITDNRFTGGVITYHSASPATPANQLPASVVNPAQAGAYYFLITSPGGCTDEGQIDVGLKPLPNVTFAPADSFSLCKDGMQLVTATASGGGGGYSFVWSTGNQTPSITVSAAANPGSLDTYRLTVTDAAGCTALDTVRVRTTNSIDSLQRSIVHVSACGVANGQINLNPLNGLPPFHYVWTSSNGVSGAASGVNGAYSITGLPQGSYRVTITDSSNPPCPFVLRQILVNGPDAVINPPLIVPVSCRGASDGAICLNVFGTNLQYLWSTGETTTCVNGLSGGAYSVTITSGDCQTVLNDIAVPEPDSLSILANLLSPSCFDSTNGSINLSVFGGTPPYQFLWNTGVATRDIHGLAAGVYAVSITDTKGCLLTRSFTLTAPSPLEAGIDSIQSPVCFGLNSGYIRVSGSGGTAPYQYAWSSGTSSPVLFQAGAGLYQVTVTDLNGCRALRSIPLSEPPPLDLITVEVNRPDCVGSTDGSILVGANGGTPPYTFTWSNGQSGTTIQDLAVGTYSVTLTDAGNCPGPARVFQLDPLSVLQLQIDAVAPACVGRADGSISLQPSGTQPFSFFWADNGSQSALRNGLGAGEYEVSIMDGRGCRYDTIIPLTAPQVFEVQMNILPPACHDGQDGIIDVTLVQAGEFPYDFQWSNGSPAEDLIGAPAGTYILTITDANACRYITAPALIPNPAPLEMDLIGMGPVLCHGDSNGFIEVSVSGGTPPYTNPSLFGIPAGTYSLQATDSRFCPVNLTVNLPAPPPLIVNISNTQSGDCQALVVTRLEAVVSGGVPPYRYSWSNRDTVAVIVNAAPGDYSLTVQDANGCNMVLGGVKVSEQIAPLNISTFAPANVSCFGAQNGSLTVRLSGGSSLYRYHFSTNHITTTASDSVRLTGLSPGANYRVTVTDVNTGCVQTAGPVSITQPQPLVFFRTTIGNVTCSGSSSGFILATTGGGTSPYQYQWFDGDGTLVGEEEDLTNVAAGIYTGILVDAGGCTVTLANQTILEIHEPIVPIDSLVMISGVLCTGSNGGSISVAVSGGMPPYQYTWSNGAAGPSITGLPAGEYFVTATDNALCSIVLGPFELATSPAISVGINATPPDMSGGNGVVTALVSGGTSPFVYFWSTGDTTASVNQLGPGAYFLTVTDAAGCTASASAVLVHTAEAEPAPVVRFSPNPGAGLFYLEFDSAAAPVERLVIRGMDGRLRYQMPLDGSRSGRENLQLDMLPAGMYMLELYSRGRPAFRQLFVNSSSASQ